MRATADIVGLAIRHGRTLDGLTQAELAKKLGVSRKWIIDVERGRANASYEMLFRAAEKMGFKIEIFDRPAPEDDSQGLRSLA